MGKIEKFCFRKDERDDSDLDKFIRSVPYFCEYDPDNNVYYFRDPERRISNDPTPECEIWIEEGGVCCNWLGGNAVCKAVHGKLYEELCRRFGDVKVEL